MRKALLILFLAQVVSIAGVQLSQAQTYSLLYSFGGATGDGVNPSGTLVQDQQGNFYGSTQAGGGPEQLGTVFKLTSDGTEATLYNFKMPPDASSPLYGLLRDGAGNLYGATEKAGAYGYGAVFKLDASGNETVLHSFGSGTDGQYPSSALLRDANGNLYGTTGGGGKYGAGTVYQITPTGAERILHHFRGVDGATPVAGLIRDAQGDFLGTTSTGGTYGNGVVFKLAPNGTETTLYSFCALPGCLDGRNPESTLIQDLSGNFFSTSMGGGASDQGTVFRLSKTGVETVLYSFGTISSGDGRWPWGGVTPDSQGNLYGTTFTGGQYGAGTIFKLDRTGKETVVYSFCAEANCADGSGPAFGSLVRDRAGNFYGAAQGGPYQSGVIFKLTP